MLETNTNTYLREKNEFFQAFFRFYFPIIIYFVDRQISFIACMYFLDGWVFIILLCVFYVFVKDSSQKWFDFD